MDALTNLPAFLFALGLIVFVHEMGHFFVAKLFGVTVLTFSLGFGRRLWGFTHKETEYRIALIPLGGYVRMAGELPEERGGDVGDFLGRPRWQRILIYLAGPAMNIVLSVILVAGLAVVGSLDPNPDSTEIGYVTEGSAAAAAGLLPGDRITWADGKKIERWDSLSFLMITSPGKTLPLVVERAGRSFRTELTPRPEPRRLHGVAGFYPARDATAPEDLSLIQALASGLRLQASIFRQTGQLLGKLLSRQLPARSVISGPVEIAIESGKAARAGLLQWIFLVALLSTSIGLMNLLPIPLLDGGHILILLLESLRRQDLPLMVKERAAQVGFVLLMTLMATTVVLDLAKNLPALTFMG